MMAVNFFGAVLAAQAALASLIARRGQIVVISSIAGFSPLIGRPAYAASKHALPGFFNSLRLWLPAPTARRAWWISRLAPRAYEWLMLCRVGAEFNLTLRSPA